MTTPFPTRRNQPHSMSPSTKSTTRQNHSSYKQEEWHPRRVRGCQAPHPVARHPGGSGGSSYVLARVTLCQYHAPPLSGSSPTQTTLVVGGGCGRCGCFGKCLMRVYIHNCMRVQEKTNSYPSSCRTWRRGPAQPQIPYPTPTLS